MVVYEPRATSQPTYQTPPTQEFSTYSKPAEVVLAGPHTQARDNVDAYGNPVHVEAEVVRTFKLNPLALQAVGVAGTIAAGITLAIQFTGTGSPNGGTPAALARECPQLSPGNPLANEKLSAISEYLNRAAIDLQELGTPLCKTPALATAQGQEEIAVVFETQSPGQYVIFNVLGTVTDAGRQHIVSAANVVQIAP